MDEVADKDAFAPIIGVIKGLFAPLHEDIKECFDFVNSGWFWTQARQNKLLKYLDFAEEEALAKTARSLFYAFKYAGTMEGLIQLGKGIFGERSTLKIEDTERPAVVKIQVRNANVKHMKTLIDKTNKSLIDEESGKQIKGEKYKTEFCLLLNNLQEAISFNPFGFFKRFLTPGRVLMDLDISSDWEDEKVDNDEERRKEQERIDAAWIERRKIIKAIRRKEQEESDRIQFEADEKVRIHKEEEDKKRAEWEAELKRISEEDEKKRIQQEEERKENLSEAIEGLKKQLVENLEKIRENEKDRSEVGYKFKTWADVDNPYYRKNDYLNYFEGEGYHTNKNMNIIVYIKFIQTPDIVNKNAYLNEDGSFNVGAYKQTLTKILDDIKEIYFYMNLSEGREWNVFVEYIYAMMLGYIEDPNNGNVIENFIAEHGKGVTNFVKLYNEKIVLDVQLEKLEEELKQVNEAKAAAQIILAEEKLKKAKIEAIELMISYFDVIPDEQLSKGIEKLKTMKEMGEVICLVSIEESIKILKQLDPRLADATDAELMKAIEMFKEIFQVIKTKYTEQIAKLEERLKKANDAGVVQVQKLMSEEEMKKKYEESYKNGG